MSPDLSIILPVLQPNDDYFRCITSIRAALQNKILYEIIVVTPDVSLFTEVTNHSDLSIYSEEVPGIYGAMNAGIIKATGLFLYFIGQDDILLPSSAEAILQGKREGADLLIANVFWGKNRMFTNYLSRKYLAWNNWCHQGIFYNRERFIKDVGSYPVEFKTQADHYVNIVLSSVSSIVMKKYHGCVAWYSADGFSSRSPDLVFRPVFPNLVRQHIGLLSYRCVIIRRLLLNSWKSWQKRNNSR